MSDIFQMDTVIEEQYAQQQPSPSTSTSSSPILLEYAPKQPTTVLTSYHESSTGIKTWLATHTSSYLPHDQPHPRGFSPRRAKPTRFALSSSSSSASDDDHHSDADSSDSDEEDAIFLQPRRHLSRQGSAQTSPVSRPALPTATTKKINSLAPHHHLHLTAQRPALPLVDLSAASGHLALDLDDFVVVPQLDKSHWSDDDEDDEDESAYSDADSDLVEEDGLWALHPDELDVPALVEDEEGNPASTSTRSIPIPSPAPVAVARAGGRLRGGCYDVESPPTRRKSMEGQSFWTPWMDQYLADAAAVAQAAR